MIIKFDKNNYRKHNDKNKSLINKSLSECGAGRSICIDSENEIIAGNGIYEEAQKLNIPVKIIETDGTELIAVKRTDLKADDEKRKQLAIMDNSTNDTSEFDIEKLQAEFSTDVLNDYGIELDLGKKAENQIKENTKGEIEFTNELLEEQNYIVLTFDNQCDWLTACELLDIKTVKTSDSRDGYMRTGVGRVFKGEQFLRGLNACKD